MTRTYVTRAIPAGTTPLLRFRLQDAAGSNGDLVPDAIAATLYDVGTGTVLGTPALSPTAEGLVEWRLTPAETRLVNPARLLEQHIARIEWRWDDGSKIGKHELALTIRNLDAFEEDTGVEI